MAMMMGNVEDVVLASTGSATIAIASTAVIYTRSFPIKYAEYFGIHCKAASTGTPSLKIELEESFSVPSTEGASNTAWVVPEGFANVFANLNDTLAHVKSLNPVPMMHARFKITGLATNPADTTLALKLFRQERM